jgi:predicted MFS family arabinose efflux permease
MLAGFTSSYWALLALFFMAGVGNAVFHPADYSILSASVDQKMLGRAFSVHSFGGSAGMALAPPAMLILTGLWGWRSALVIAGATGILLAALVWLWGDVLRDHATGAAGKKPTPLREQLKFLLSCEIVLMFLFFLVSSAGGTGISVFCVSALVELYGMSLADSNWIFTMFMILSSVGVIAGGFLADRTQRHDLVLVITYAISTITICAVGLGTLSLWLLIVMFAISGLMRGVVNPSRDVMVRHAAPEGTVGTVFAWVTTGFSVGQGTSPVVYGWFMDAGAPDWVFYVSGAFGVLNIALVFVSKKRTL